MFILHVIALNKFLIGEKYQRASKHETTQPSLPVSKVDVKTTVIYCVTPSEQSGMERFDDTQVGEGVEQLMGGGEAHTHLGKQFASAGEAEYEPPVRHSCVRRTHVTAQESSQRLQVKTLGATQVPTSSRIDRQTQRHMTEHLQWTWLDNCCGRTQ